MEGMKGMALVYGIPHERFSELYWKLRPPYDRGDIDGPAYWTAIVGQQELGVSRDQIATQLKILAFLICFSRQWSSVKFMQ
jgi:putative hydrolase of the HAD superfamily